MANKLQQHILQLVPGARLIAQYQPSWLRRDLIAGVVLSTLLVPQGMAYAELAGLPPITGLYTTILCLTGYALFGPSRILVLGPDSSLGPIIAAIILPLAASNGSSAQAISLASLLALMVGLIMVFASIAKLGFIADLLSKPTQVGYVNGLALTILISQLPKLFGFSVSADGLFQEFRGFVQAVAAGEAVAAAAAIGIACLVLMLALSRWLPKVPSVLVAVVGAIAASAILNLGNYGVALVGSLPQGLPPLTFPGEAMADWPLLLAGAAGIALVTLTDTISTASAFAVRSKQELDSDGEMRGLGLANAAAGLFQGFPVSTSGSRTAVAERAGAKTQVAGLVGALAIVAMLLFLPGLLKNLPQPTLAAVVITASLSLVNIPAATRLWQQRRIEFLLCVAAFLGVAFLGVLEGIAIAVLLSIFNIFRRAWWPYQTTLGRVPGLPGYHDIRQYPHAEQLPGLVIFRFDGPLFFANSRIFRDQIRHLANAAQRPAWIVIAAEPITDVDTTAADTLEELDRTLNNNGTSLIFAELKNPVRLKLERYELIGPLNPAHFFPTLDAAVKAFRQQTGTSWSKP